MAERALRGTRLGATSYENDRNTDLAPRQDVAFNCPNGHHFSVPFAAEAELPPTWECRICGAIAVAATGESPSPKKVKPPRSHWDMLMERRTVADRTGGWARPEGACGHSSQCRRDRQRQLSGGSFGQRDGARNGLGCAAVSQL